MKINHNIQALISRNTLTTNENQLANSTERLSSGYKINHARENPAGLAISYKMNAQIRGLKRASQNAANGISVIEAAEGALTEIQAMVQRMNELAVQAATGTIVSTDRNAIQKEIDQLCEEIERIAKDTEFNTQSLLDGEQELKGYTDWDSSKVRFYSDDVKAQDYTVTYIFDSTGAVTVTPAGGFSSTATVEYEDGTATITDMNGFEIIVDTDIEKMKAEAAGKTPPITIPPATGTVDVPINLDVTGIGGMTFQVGANEGQTINVIIPEISLKNMGIENIDCSTQESALEAIDMVDVALEFISQTRSSLGAYQNRLDHTISSLDITGENMTAAYSRLMDVDMADEMVEYTKLQVLTQAGTSMLAQANERPQSALQLLQ